MHESRLAQELAPRILPVVLANVTTRYPYYDAHLAVEGEAPRDPTVAHSAFGNSFDWHSSVHSHWTALQLLKYFTRRASDAPDLAPLRSAIVANIAPAHVAREAEYLAAHPSYERPYGWAWAMLLAAALFDGQDRSLRGAAAALQRMADWIASAAAVWLPVLPHPIRHGVHSNTAFSLGLMLDAARAMGLGPFEATVARRAREFFAGDRRWPEALERSGNDFLSPGLAEADLMRRILARDSFEQWWSGFFADLSPSSRVLSAAVVPGVSDGHIVHLHGLNLSRAAALARIAETLEDVRLLECAGVLYYCGVAHAYSGDYLSTHWLPTFAWDAATSIDRAAQVLT